MKSIERGLERRYREEVERKAAHPPRLDGPRNGRIVGVLIRHPKQAPYVQLEGRVALVDRDPDRGGATELYPGRAYARVDGVDIYDWRSPLRRLFFGSSLQDPLADNVREFMRSAQCCWS